jgi:hypothetical protein
MMEYYRFFPDKFGINKRRRTTVTSKLRSLGIDFGDENEMLPIGGGIAPVSDLTTAVSENVIQQRLLHLESTVNALKQELSVLRANPVSKGADSAKLHDATLSQEVYLDVTGSAGSVAAFT